MYYLFLVILTNSNIKMYLYDQIKRLYDYQIYEDVSTMVSFPFSSETFGLKVIFLLLSPISIHQTSKRNSSLNKSNQRTVATQNSTRHDCRMLPPAFSLPSWGLGIPGWGVGGGSPSIQPIIISTRVQSLLDSL